MQYFHWTKKKFSFLVLSVCYFYNRLLYFELKSKTIEHQKIEQSSTFDSHCASAFLNEETPKTGPVLSLWHNDTQYDFQTSWVECFREKLHHVVTLTEKKRKNQVLIVSHSWSWKTQIKMSLIWIKELSISLVITQRALRNTNERFFYQITVSHSQCIVFFKYFLLLLFLYFYIKHGIYNCSK